MDALTLAIIDGRMQQVTEEMDQLFVEAALSPVIAEGRDRASGIYTTSGEVVAQGHDGLPLFVSVMQFAVTQVLHALRDLQPGDVVLVNDPYTSGTHLMDVKAVSPVFVDGHLVACVANTGHWQDIGGSVAGGFATRAREFYAEGVLIPPVRIVRRGELQKDLVRLLFANIRVPEEGRADLEAQLGAIDAGAEQLAAIYSEFGTSSVERVITELRHRSEKLMRKYIAGIPDGVYQAQDHLDSDGVVNRPLRINLAITVEGSEMSFDFTGSSPPCLGPMNCVYPTTVSACWLALKHIFPLVPVNAGSFVPCHFHVPEETFLRASSPRPVSGCAAEVSQRIVDTVFRALGDALPDDVPAAPFSTVNNLALGGEDRGRRYVMYLYGGGGYGGHKRGDGLTNGPSTVSNAPHPGIEVYEQRAPVLFRRYELRANSAGPGEHQGGFGTIREFELTNGSALASFLGDRGRFPPFGLHGGGPAYTTTLELYIDGCSLIPEHLTKAENIELTAGDVIRVATPGGGGWGSPELRPVELVARDLQYGYITPSFARRHYSRQFEYLSRSGDLNSLDRGSSRDM